jgi:hypothetical protein
MPSCGCSTWPGCRWILCPKVAAGPEHCGPGVSVSSSCCVCCWAATSVVPAAISNWPVASAASPVLAGRHSSSPLGFNLSHSDGWLAVAVARDRDVGVDVERERVVADEHWPWPRRYFPAAEGRQLSGLDEPFLSRAFLELLDGARSPGQGAWLRSGGRDAGDRTGRQSAGTASVAAGVGHVALMEPGPAIVA